MATITKKTPAVPINRIEEALERRRMSRHSPEQKVALLDAVTRRILTLDEVQKILEEFGMNSSAYVRWMKETRG